MLPKRQKNITSPYRIRRSNYTWQTTFSLLHNSNYVGACSEPGSIARCQVTYVEIMRRTRKPIETVTLAISETLHYYNHHHKVQLYTTKLDYNSVFHTATAVESESHPTQQRACSVTIAEAFRLDTKDFTKSATDNNALAWLFPLRVLGCLARI